MIKSAATFLAFVGMVTAQATLERHISPESVIAPGPPALTNEMADKLSGFFQFALELTFTDAQREEYRHLLIEEWADGTQRTSALALLASIAKAANASQEQRRRIQTEVGPALLTGLRKSPDSAEARWITAVYDAPRMSSDNAEKIQGADAVYGKWRATHAAAVQYKDSYTGALAPTSGSSFAYEFAHDGSYAYHGTLQVTAYGCTSSVIQHDSGNYRLVGNRLFLEPVEGSVPSRTCGGEAKEKVADRATREYAIHFENSGSSRVLVIGDVDGKARPDFFRSER